MDAEMQYARWTGRITENNRTVERTGRRWHEKRKRNTNIDLRNDHNKPQPQLKQQADQTQSF